MFNMDEKEITKFVEWLVKDGEAPAGSTFEEVVSWINELSTSQEGQQLLNKLVKTYQNKKSGLFKKGGRLHQLLCFKSGGKGPDCGCGKKIEKAAGGSAGVIEGNSNESNKRRRTDMAGYAWSHSDGTQVLTQDAVGPQPLPGSYSEIEGSSPEFETQRTAQTDKGGNILGYNYKVFNNGGDTFFPIARYTTRRTPFNLRYKILSEPDAKRFNDAYVANGFKNGGKFR